MESLIRRWLWCQENVGISTEMATETETFHKSHFVWNDHGDGTDDDDGDDDVPHIFSHDFLVFWKIEAEKAWVLLAIPVNGPII
jgi:hypothetical protein